MKKGWAIFFKVAMLSMWAFAATVAAQFIVGIVMSCILGSGTLSKPIPLAIYYILADVVAASLVIFVPVGLTRKWKDKSHAKKHAAKDKDEEVASLSRTELGLKGWPTWTDIGLAPVGYIVSILLAAGLVAVFSQFTWFNAEQAQETGFTMYMGGAARIISFVALVVVAPIAEEVIFRGWLYGKLRQGLSDLPEWAGVGLSTLIVSVIFGIIHFQWNVGVNVFCLSVVLCALREVTGTIYAGVFTHILRNCVAFYFLYMLGGLA